jgi:hypothetical protein
VETLSPRSLEIYQQVSPTARSVWRSTSY